MSFTTLSPALIPIAERALAYCRTEYGTKGLKIEEGIDPSISWRPTFFLRPKRFEIIAFEVSDIIFPDVIKGASHDIRHFSGLIRVVLVCPLEMYQSDKDQKRITTLRLQGFGMLTVGADGSAIRQFDCIPLSQFVTRQELETLIRDLPNALKVRLREARNSYLVSAVKGVQDCREIVEGLIVSIAKQSQSSTSISNSDLKSNAATIIDKLYSSDHFKDYRAALGGVRSFIKLYGNAASHAPRTARQAAERVKDLREGFISALRNIGLLANTARKLHLKVVVHS